MLASDLLSLGAAIIGLLTALAGSSACAYASSRAYKLKKKVLTDRLLTVRNLLQRLENQLKGIVVFTPDPSTWFREAQEFLNQADLRQLELSVDEKCKMGWLPNFCAQMRVRNLIELKIAGLDGLIERYKDYQNSTVKGFKQLPEVTIVGESREKTVEEIWKLVSGSEKDTTVFIHGTFGVGKTAIAKYIHNKALAEAQLFDYVMWLSLGHEVDLWHVQQHLARRLEVDMSRTNSPEERAQALADALNRKGKFLLVLDSLWQAFSLKEIGIPDPIQGSKLIVISRIRTACAKIQGKRSFEIKPLNDVSDALKLFTTEARPNVKPKIAYIKKAVVELDGLPLLIKMLADYCPDSGEMPYLPGERLEKPEASFDSSWRVNSAPTYLRSMNQELFNHIKQSYENLGMNAQRCFLLCASFPNPHSIPVKELIDHWMWDGQSSEIETLKECRKQGYRALEELKNAHILEAVAEEGKEDSVKMLKLVQSITTMPDAGNKLFVRSGNSLTDLPFAWDWPPEVERASFMQNQLNALILKGRLNCKWLSTLLLQDNPLVLDPHEDFFNDMRELRVLDLSRAMIAALPKSLSSLINLHGLLLRNCPNLRVLPNLSKLEQLIVLDLSGTPLEQFPIGVRNMKNLRRLDLSLTRIEIFPANVVLNLKKLEELLLITDDNGGYVWGSNPADSPCLVKLVKFGKLTVLELNFMNTGVFNSYVNACAETEQNLRFRFCVGGFYSGQNVGQNSVVVIGDYRVTLPDRTSELYLMMNSEKLNVLMPMGESKGNGGRRIFKSHHLMNLTVLDVSNFTNLQYLFSVEILGSLKKLKKLSVKRCKKMKGIIQPAQEGNPATVSLPELTTMVFFDLPELESICRGQVLECPNLSSVGVWSCLRLKLPKAILGEKNGKVEIKGESIWIDKLEWERLHNSTSPCHENPQPNPDFKLVNESVPADLEATPRLIKKELKGGSSSGSVSDVPEKKYTSISNWLWRKTYTSMVPPLEL